MGLVGYEISPDLKKMNLGIQRCHEMGTLIQNKMTWLGIEGHYKMGKCRFKRS